MRGLVWLLVVGLLVAHQVDPFGGDSRLIGGVVPVALAYHAGLAVAAGGVWWLVTVFAWPADAEVADESATGEEPAA